jgi:[NiFe] hydrogenase assembly HybE family chaperone
MPEACDIPAEISDRLAAVFTKIQAERMDGVPILNPRLEVEVLGVRALNDHWLALLITPWFINLMLLPATPEQEEAWRGLALGSNVPHRLPAGRFDFIVGEESALGRYQMCSLFSPVLEFQDQAAARIAGRAALEALFDADLDAGAAKDKDAAAGSSATNEPAVAAPPSEVSRRGLLMGKLTQERDPV